MNNKYLLSIAIIITLLSSSNAYTKELPRTIIALYDSKTQEVSEDGLLHSFAEMPLNHLGFILEYHDINKPLPDINNRSDVNGVISWFAYNVDIKDKKTYVDWLVSSSKAGKKIAILGNSGTIPSKTDKIYNLQYANNIFARIGLKLHSDEIDGIYGVEFSKVDKNIFWYEREIDLIKPSYRHVTNLSKSVNKHLVARLDGNENNDSIISSSNESGCYVANDYAILLTNENNLPIRNWYLNPFNFFKKCFGGSKMPIPDTTTIAGRRIYYSHIDGDGWNSISHITTYKQHKDLSAKVILEEAIKPYPDLPISVSIVAADINDNWFGSQQSRDVAIEIMSLPNVEAGTHTYSHPFDWSFFANLSGNDEEKYLSSYKTKTWGDNFIDNNSNILSYLKPNNKKPKDYTPELEKNYTIPRAYAVEKFNLEKEIAGSVNEIINLLPQNKNVPIMMWTGDTRPFDAAIELTRDLNMRNINGGDSRYDIEYPSIAWLSPIGRKKGNQQQIYSSASNENTYTKLWRGRFYGFKFLQQTVDNTEKPIRLKPFNIYYHMYTGERKASLGALIHNLEYARKSDISPITASNFAGIADGFFSTKINKISNNSWQINNRDLLQTVRFDDAKKIFVDFAKSKGVIGYRKFNDSIYVYLDRKNNDPVVAIKNNPKTNSIYLVDSRWQIWDLVKNKGKMSFKTYGFGDADMTWKVPDNKATYTVQFANQIKKIKPDNGLLHISFDNKIPQLMEIFIRY